MPVKPSDESQRTDSLQPQKNTSMPGPLLAIYAFVRAIFNLFASKETKFDLYAWFRGATDAHDYSKINTEEIKSKIEGIGTIDDYRRFCRNYSTTKLFESNHITSEQKAALDKLYLILRDYKPEVFTGNRVQEIWNERYNPKKYNQPSTIVTTEIESETLKSLCRKIANKDFVQAIPKTFQQAIFAEKLKKKDKNLKPVIENLTLPKETLKMTFKFYGRFESNKSEVITVAQWEHLLLSGQFPQRKNLYNIDSWKNFLKIAQRCGVKSEWYDQIKTAIDTAGDYKFLGVTFKTDGYKPEKLYTAFKGLLRKK